VNDPCKRVLGYRQGTSSSAKTGRDIFLLICRRFCHLIYQSTSNGAVQINTDGDFDLQEFDPLSAIDIPLALLHANIKARATIPGGPFSTQYERLPRDCPYRPFQLRLPDKFNGPNIQPIDFFKLFFIDEIIDILVQNTNLYAKLKGVRITYTGPGRRWKPVTRHEISVYLALLIYIGLSRGQSIEAYWDFNGVTYH
jgi:hypothetical protein